MPRRAKTSLHPLHLLGMAAAIVVIAGAGWFFLAHKPEGNFGGTDLSVSEYLQNSNALSNNSYRIEGTVRGSGLDDGWKSSEGRLFSVEVEEGGQSTPLPCWVPSKFNGTNIQRDQRFRFKVTVQPDGILQVTSLEKS